MRSVEIVLPNRTDRTPEPDVPRTVRAAKVIHKSQMEKRPDIQGLRAIAALAVVFFHASDLLPGGFLGVDVFFVISGFIVAQIARTEIALTGQFFLVNFIQRRLRRVLPPMAVVVLATLMMGALIDTPSRMIESLPLTSIAALTSTINIYFFLEATDYFQSFKSDPLLHLWSLAVEIHFYLLFGVALKLALTLKCRLRARPASQHVLFLVAGLSATSLIAALTIGTWHGVVNVALPKIFSFFTLPTRIWEFGFGIAAYLAQRRFRRWLSDGVALHLIQIASGVGLFLGLKFGSNALLVPGFQAIAPCLASATLLATGGQGVVGRALSCPGLTYVGDRSYSIYLWQGPLIVFAGHLFAAPWAIALAAIASILVSIVTYETVESMFRKPKGGVRPAQEFRTGLPAAYLGAVLISWAAYLAAPATIGRFAAPAPQRATDLDKTCQRQRGTLGIAPCVYGESGRPKLLLIGDSHAGAISQAVIDAASRAGWQAHVATASACAVPEYPENVTYRSTCAGYTENVLSYARKQQISLAIVHQFSEFYVGNLGIGLARWKQGLSDLVSRFEESRISVLVVGDNLRLPLAVGRAIWANAWLADLRGALEERRVIEEAERLSATSVPGSRYLQARDYLCHGAICPVFTQREWWYTDADHLSCKGAEKLVGPIEKEIRRRVPHPAVKS